MIILTAALLVVFLGLTALAVDVALGYANQRALQGIADTSAMAALQAVPRTLTQADAENKAQQAAQDLADSNAAANGTPPVSVTANVILEQEQIDVSLDAALDSPISFGRSISTSTAFELGAFAEGRIDTTQTDKLLPIGFEDVVSNPAQCFEPVGGIPEEGNEPRVCQSSFQGHLNAMFAMVALNPPADCAVGWVVNMKIGVDHPIDTDAATDPRPESLACAEGHIATLPNAADNTLIPSSSAMTEGLIGAGAALATPSAPLWAYLLPTNTGDCAPSAFPADDPTNTRIISDRTVQMRTCLREWRGGRIFSSGVTSSPRFGWGVQFSGTGMVPFQLVTPMFLNSVVSDDAAVANPPQVQEYLDGIGFPGRVGAFTFFAVRPEMLSSTDEASLRQPAGLAGFEFLLTD